MSTNCGPQSYGGGLGSRIVHWINGKIVGGLVGGALYTISLLAR
jgi:hypothetical protein